MVVIRSDLLSTFSLRTVKIDCYFDDTWCGNGSGFLYEKQSKIYLITNRHIVTGKNVLTQKHLHKSACEPNKIKIHLLYLENGQPKKEDGTLTLYENDQPRWLQYKDNIDVVAIDTNYSKPALLKVFTDSELTNQEIYPGHEVLIVGYPGFLLKSQAASWIEKFDTFPIWKKGNIASEPILSLDDSPLLIDSATRPGMSGSAVLTNIPTLREDESGIRIVPHIELIGIYSGRLTSPEFDFQDNRVEIEDDMTKSLFFNQIGMVYGMNTINKLFEK